MSTAAKQSFMQAVEYLIIGGLAIGVLYLFGDNPDLKTAALTVLISVLGGAGAKYGRANPNIPIEDYVNDVKE